MGRRSPSFGARFLARALKIIKSLRSPVIGQDQFAGRLVAARPVGNFAVPVVLFPRSEEHTSELHSLMRIPSTVFCLQKTKATSKPYRDPTPHDSPLLTE